MDDRWTGSNGKRRKLGNNAAEEAQKEFRKIPEINPRMKQAKEMFLEKNFK